MQIPLTKSNLFHYDNASVCKSRSVEAGFAKVSLEDLRWPAPQLHTEHHCDELECGLRTMPSPQHQGPSSVMLL